MNKQWDVDWVSWRKPPLNGDAIPRFVVQNNYAKNFGEQWEQYPLTQLDSHTGLNLSAERLKRCLGEELWSTLENKTVLECGCGAGRFTEILLEKGARVVSIDLSSAVDTNAKLFPVSHKHIVAQADILDLPFVEEQFDVVLCLGVLQHTENTEQSIAELFTQVRPGGALVFDHYRFENSYISMRYFYRHIFKRLSSVRALSILKILAKVFLPLHKAFRNSYWLSMFLNRVSPFVSYYRTLPKLRDDLQDDWALLDTHETLTDWFKRFRNTDQIIHTLEKIGAQNIWCEKGGNGVEARAWRRS